MVVYIIVNILVMHGHTNMKEKFSKFSNVVLEKGGKDHLDGSCEKEVLHRGKEERNFLHTIKRKKANNYN